VVLKVSHSPLPKNLGNQSFLESILSGAKKSFGVGQEQWGQRPASVQGLQRIIL